MTDSVPRLVDSPAAHAVDVDAVEASGVIAGGLRIYEAVGCSLNDASASGKVGANALTLDIRGIDMSMRGSLPKRADVP
jgi:hypothetical protein